jgi:cytochrome o ubiquinol oxidase operon protein cyoD
LLLTLLAYFAVVNQWSSGGLLVAFILTLAVTQFIVQLIFFLHLGQEDKPRWNLTTFWSALLVLIMVIFGSIWIIKNLNARTGHHMTPQETEEFIIKDEGYEPR